MGNHALLPHRFTHSPPSRYSHIDSKSNHEQDLGNTQVDQWDSSWKDVTHQNIYYRIEYGKLHTFRNHVTTEEIQRYRTVLNDKNDFEKWKEMVHWRSNSQYLVKIEHFSLQNKGEVCVSQFQLNLFIERIPLRLIDLTDIPYPQNLYFLLCVLKGFKYIFSSPFPIKSFRVTQSMICVNTEGQVKVWFNPNLSEFEPIKQNYTTHATQQDILRGLIDLVEQNTDQRDYLYPFRQYLLDKNILINGDYNSIIQQVYTYAKDMKVAIPKYAFSVRDILNKDFLNTNKLDSENSFSQKPHFRHQNSQINKDTSLSVLNSYDFQPFKKQQVHFQKQIANVEYFPQQKTRGLASNNQILNHNFPTVTELPSLNPNLHNDQKYHQTQSQTPILFHNHLRNETNAKITQPELKNHLPIKNPLTDRDFRNENINQHLMRINRIGNNIIQFHQPEFSYQPNQMPQIQPQNVSRRQVHSLQKPFAENYRGNTGPVPPPPAPPGYKMVERKIIHPVNFDPLKDPKIPIFSPLVQSRSFPAQNEFKNYQIPQNQAFTSIQRVNSANIPFPMAQKSQTSDYQTRSNSVQKVPMLNLGATIRPSQLSNNVHVERINRQSSYKTFLSSENPSENIRKTNSFKNSLIKHQSEEKQVERAVSNVKYFTKKDLQETLDPQIAGDLMKYLSQQI